MKKIVRLTERDLARIVKRVVREVDETQYEEPSAELFASLEKNVDQDEDDDIESITQQVAEDWYRRKMNRRRLNENINNVLEIKKCYSNSGKPFPTSCEKGAHKDCKEKIRSTATSFFQGNKNAQNDPKISKFWGCINKVDPSILAGMG